MAEYVEYTHIVEGGHTLEVVPGIFVTNRITPESRMHGERTSFYQFTEASEYLGLEERNASRAFKLVYTTLKQSAVEKGILRLEQAFGKRIGWDYLYNTNVNKQLRSRLMLSTQAIHDIFQENTTGKKGSEPLQQHLKVMETLLGLDELREDETAMADAFIPPALEEAE